MGSMATVTFSAEAFEMGFEGRAVAYRDQDAMIRDRSCLGGAAAKGCLIRKDRSSVSYAC